MLTLAGAGTWALVTWLALSQTLSPIARVITGSGYVSFLILFLLISTHFLYKYSQRTSRLVVYSQAILTLILIRYDANMITPILLVIWASQLPGLVSKRLAIFSLLSVNLIFYLIHNLNHESTSAGFTVLIYMGFQFFAYSSSQARLSEADARMQQEILNQQLIATRSLLSQSSQHQERVRISRDLHDILGHQLTALSLQLEVLSHKVSEETKSEVEQSKQLAKELLSSIRAVVKKQRDIVGLDLSPAIKALMNRLPGITLNISNLPPLTSTELAQDLVLILQEGISNAVRHGQANTLWLDMSQEQNKINIILKDNGNMSNTTALPGSGLKGMNERLAPFNGHVELKVSGTNNGVTMAGAELHISCEQPKEP
ncbi:two-component sensor histidine kinase [Shewanella eurypsychrophilus]|uniref:Two-component sensor histidine kinase n=1 Tax=Shewanella eurypsychrophilus TaxID=2593656 RepID=A0ABX6V9H8_9GAMM|nr:MULTISPECIES: histidine kinase [Shewanella]QFU23794.1 two-component sensor histidine kinase [Shewanella sp. YLB-09]QPG59017.1 two-component sensor histidine kinase [Shewanella eurypsychrophilus]